MPTFLVSLFIFYIFSYLLSKTMGYLSGQILKLLMTQRDVMGRELRPRKGIPSREGNLKSRGFQTPENTLPAESVASLGSTEGNITGRKNK